MCDYSLQNCKTRDAAVDDQLTTGPIAVSGMFGGKTSTRGFHAKDATYLAICLRPGTEVAFSAPVKFFKMAHGGLVEDASRYTTAVFREVNTDQPHVHHDTLELPDGTKVLVHLLVEGQSARVLQLGVDPKVTRAEGRPVPAPIQEPAPTEPEPLKA